MSTTTPTFNELSELFHLPAVQAAKALGIGRTQLQVTCRTFGIPRWPYRRLAALRRQLDTLTVEAEADPSQHEVLLLRQKHLLDEIMLFYVPPNDQKNPALATNSGSKRASSSAHTEPALKRQHHDTQAVSSSPNLADLDQYAPFAAGMMAILSENRLSMMNDSLPPATFQPSNQARTATPRASNTASSHPPRRNAFFPVGFQSAAAARTKQPPSMPITSPDIVTSSAGGSSDASTPSPTVIMGPPFAMARRAAAPAAAPAPPAAPPPTAAPAATPTAANPLAAALSATGIARLSEQLSEAGITNDMLRALLAAISSPQPTAMAEAAAAATTQPQQLQQQQTNQQQQSKQPQQPHHHHQYQHQQPKQQQLQQLQQLQQQQQHEQPQQSKQQQQSKQKQQQGQQHRLRLQ